MPRNLTEISDRRLMELFSIYVGWQNYFDVLLGEAFVEEKKADASAERVAARFMLSSGLTKVTEARWMRDAAHDPDVAMSQRIQVDAYARRKALEMTCGNLDRMSSLVSRELSRRIGRDPVQRRNDRGNA